MGPDEYCLMLAQHLCAKYKLTIDVYSLAYEIQGWVEANDREEPAAVEGAQVASGGSAILPASKPMRDERDIKQALADLQREYNMRAEPFISALVRIESIKPPAHVILGNLSPTPATGSGGDDERDTLVGALLDEWQFKTDGDLAYEMRENGIGKRLDALLAYMDDPEERTHPAQAGGDAGDS